MLGVTLQSDVSVVEQGEHLGRCGHLRMAASRAHDWSGPPLSLSLI